MVAHPSEVIMKDWEVHAARLHNQPSNRKFINGTRRTERDLPVIEQFDCSGDFADLVVLISCTAALAVVALLLAFEMLPRLVTL